MEGRIRKEVKLKKQRRKLKAKKIKQRAKRLKGQIKVLKAVRGVEIWKQEEMNKALKD